MAGAEGISASGIQVLRRTVLSENARKGDAYKSIRMGIRTLSDGRILTTINQSQVNEFLKALTRGMVYKLYPVLWSEALYFRVRSATDEKGPDAFVQEASLLGPLMEREQKGDVFWVQHGCATDHGLDRWQMLFLYVFFERIPFAVFVTNKCDLDFLD